MKMEKLTAGKDRQFLTLVNTFNMTTIKINAAAKNLPDALGIQKERAEELLHKICQEQEIIISSERLKSLQGGVIRTHSTLRNG